MFEIRKRFEGLYFIFMTDVTMSNFPFSGKTYRALALQKKKAKDMCSSNFFIGKYKHVHLIQ